ncbi:hypothetical protein ACQUFY_12045 [Robbsia andropogonis]|uniref:hypothetical protein n=1 Tax=Robbsia andropogonis TaxID=28092 RepID=UPI003D1FFCFA
MKRPSFQFYPGDWISNSNLRRCTHAERGAWLDILCLMHDQEEYGVIRWPLKDIAQAANCPIALVKGLVTKGVLKGGDTAVEEEFIYRPKSGRKIGDPVTLVSAQAGPFWYSSRMVKDEYVRTIRGESSRFGDSDGESPTSSPKDAPDSSPKPPFGDGSSSSSSSSNKKHTSPSPGDPLPIGFERFWKYWPSTERKTAKAKCAEVWRKRKLEPLTDRIVQHVDALKPSKSWREGFEPAPLTYLNQSRWEDAEEGDSLPSDDMWAGAL